MGGDIDAIRAEELAAEKAAKNAEGDADAARKNADGANGNAAKLEGEEDGAANGVKGEMSDLEKCKEELRKVEEELKRLLREKDAKNGDANAAELALKKAAMEAELKQMSEAELEAKLAEEKAEWKKAQEAYEKQQQDLKGTQEALDKAAESCASSARTRTMARVPMVECTQLHSTAVPNHARSPYCNCCIGGWCLPLLVNLRHGCSVLLS